MNFVPSKVLDAIKAASFGAMFFGGLLFLLTIYMNFGLIGYIISFLMMTGGFVVNVFAHIVFT